MARKRKDGKDRTSFWIAVILHVLIIGAVGWWMARTGRLEKLAQSVLQYVRSEKKTEQKVESKPLQTRSQPAKLPPINQGLPPSSGGGTRRAVASDAPAAAGDTFFQDTRTQVSGQSTGGQPAAQARTNPIPRVTVAPKAITPPLSFTPPPRSTVSQLLAERAKATAATESFGTEQISRSGVSDAGAIVNKIAGATIVEGKFAVVRGLSDRYVSTTLNGANLPSADPYRQSVPLDLFPAQVIDKVVVTKTFTPDQPGTATGGGIDVVTKSFFEKPFFTISLGGEYNTQSSLNDRFLTYHGGGLDWLGMDDGSRALPAAVNQLTPPGRPLPDAPLSSGLIGSPTFDRSMSNAVLLDRISRAMGTTEFAPMRKAPPLNHNLAMATGGSTYLFNRPFGYFASMSYKHDYSFYENGVTRRYQNGTELKSSFRDSRSVSVVNWSGMVNLAYQPWENHELGFTFFYNQNGSDEARIQDEGKDIYDTTATYRKFNLYYIERNLQTYQMKGKHEFPDIGDLQFNWLVALTQTTQDEPNARFFNDVKTGDEYTTAGSGIPSPNKPTRYFRNLEEGNDHVNLDWILPFRSWTDEEGKIKFGLYQNIADRTFLERQFYYPGHGGYSNNPNLYLHADQLGLISLRTNYFQGRPRSVSFNWGDYVQVFDSIYTGKRDIPAAYLMQELPVLRNVRLVGGARLESTDLSVDSISYLASSITGEKTNATRLSQTDLLPSAGLIVAPASNMNVRLNYSETVARPSFRELAAYYSYDPIISDYIEGNPRLRMSAIENYDIRWEWFPRPGELVSVSLFYKDLKNAIERGNIKQEGDVITFFNNDAKLYGIEFEARRNLDFLGDSFKNFSIGGNVSLLQSEVRLSTNDLAAKQNFFTNASPTRPLYDQSPYIVNLDLSYNNPRVGTSASLIFNVAGPRLSIVKLNTQDVYEQPAPGLDFIISQKISRNATLRFAAKNLLNPRYERTYGKDSNLLYSSYQRGMAFGLSLSYEF